ncbi:MAG: hypothetical protein DRQ58_04325 [Gammaproteobacteria bacterium]|nr:MAG: hypothetical protein DRQ58_04325 [Gammaproteobacteria bacterium]
MRMLPIILIAVMSLSGCLNIRSDASDKKDVKFVNMILYLAKQQAKADGCYDGLSDIEHELCMTAALTKIVMTKDQDKFNDSMDTVDQLMAEGALKRPDMYYEWLTR